MLEVRESNKDDEQSNYIQCRSHEDADEFSLLENYEFEEELENNL
jgi:hypothetical protein